MLTTSKREQRRLDMTLTMRTVDVRYRTYQEGSYDGFIIGLQQGQEEGFALGAYQKALETTRALLILGLSPQSRSSFVPVCPWRPSRQWLRKSNPTSLLLRLKGGIAGEVVLGVAGRKAAEYNQ